MKHKIVYSWALEETMFQTSEIYSQIDQHYEARIFELVYMNHSVYIKRYYDRSELC